MVCLDQYGVLPWRRTKAHGLQVLLVTSRISKNWLIPKGWQIRGKGKTASACREAFEEAGIEGKVNDAALGAYKYIKITKTGEELPCAVTVYGLKVKHEFGDWPEMNQRSRQWYTIPAAAALVTENGLRDFLTGLDPKALK